MNEFFVKLHTHMHELTIASIHVIMFLTVLDTSCLKNHAVVQQSNSNFAQFEVALCRCIFDVKITQKSMKNLSLCVLRYVIIDDYRCVGIDY